jgi:hypothetical protein
MYGWNKVKWGMPIAEAKAVFGSDAPRPITDVGSFGVEHVEIGSIVALGAVVWSKQGRVSEVRIDVAFDLVPGISLHRPSERADMFGRSKHF